MNSKSKSENANVHVYELTKARVAVSGVAATGGLLVELKVPTVSLRSGTRLSFPLDAVSLAHIKDQCTMAPVAINKEEVILPHIRTTHQLRPHQIEIEGLTDQPAFQELLLRIQMDLDIAPGKMNAVFYKFLLQISLV